MDRCSVLTGIGSIAASAWLPPTADALGIADDKIKIPHLPAVYDFCDGKFWPNDRPGLGVELALDRLTLLGEYDTYRAGMLMNRRPDGSFTNW